MHPTTTEHRGMEIRCGYDITTDSYRANFFLPEERRKQSGFQRVITTSFPAAITPGKNHANSDTESAALTQARAMIDAYLGDE